MVKLRQVEVDLNDVVVGYILFDIALIGFEQLRFAATSNTSDYFNIRCTDYLDNSFSILMSSNKFHGATSLVQY